MLSKFAKVTNINETQEKSSMNYIRFYKENVDLTKLKLPQLKTLVKENKLPMYKFGFSR